MEQYIGLVILVIFIVFLTWRLTQLHYKSILNNLILKLEDEKKTIRKEAIESSKRVIRGKVAEEMVPMMPEFPYALSDCKFSGQPIDYIIFDGMSEVRDGSITKDIVIILADVKTNKARNTHIQKKIKEAIQAGRIRFEEWRLDKENKLTIK